MCRRADPSRSGRAQVERSFADPAPIQKDAMNATSRREKIEAMLASEPQDVFLRYSLALEWEKEQQPERCLELLTELTVELYVPAFFMAGQCLVKLGRIEDARRYLREGIEQARVQSNHHAAGEMSEFLASLGSHT